MHEALREALSGLAEGGAMRDRAKALFNALGYRSHRTLDAGGVQGFVDMLDESKPLTDRQLRLFDPWRSADIVFQVTGDEIRREIRGRPDSLLAFTRKRVNSFLFVAADLEDRPFSRAELAEMVRTVNRGFPMPVVVLFRYGVNLTLAAVHRRANKRDDNRDVLTRVILIKDIRATNPHRAHIQILADLALPGLIETGVGNFDRLHTEWERVLDIEELNKSFYGELFKWFERAVKKTRFPDDGAGEGSVERHVIRLITRLLFIWFMREKKLIPENLFEDKFAKKILKNYQSDSSDYYRAVLQNLFFATLNTEIGKRDFSKQTNTTHRDFSKYRYANLLNNPVDFMKILRQVPFINGGLFDCLDDFTSAGSGGRRIDAFTDNIKNQGSELNVPAYLFFDDRGLFPLFRRYKFTVEENTPLDQEVALDPELLGRVFENLLAAYNPETRTTARQQTGSYYTPRIVVDYMTDEALTACLMENVQPDNGDKEFWNKRLHYLLDYADACDDVNDLFSEKEQDSIVGTITKIKILDPAVGSGAFPMGMLHKLTLMLRRLDPHNKKWEKLQKEKARELAYAAFETADRDRRNLELKEISNIFQLYKDSDYGRKLYLIQNNIFGVDVQPIACQIAKLRLFISLVIEQEPNNMHTDNYGIKPLPNLETRFVAADTLLGFGKRTLTSKTTEHLKRKLYTNREQYFHATTRQSKLDCHYQDTKLRNNLAQELVRTGMPSGEADKIACWNPYDQNKTSNWFDPEYMFGVNQFDIIIGNPPYVESRNSLISEELKYSYLRQIEIDWEEKLPKGSDLLIYFYARSPKLLNDRGYGCFITQNAWLSTDYGEKFQKFSLHKISFQRITDTSAKFFANNEGPKINAIITIFTKKYLKNIEYCMADKEMKIDPIKTIAAKSEMKWGHCLAMPPFYTNILSRIRQQQTQLFKIGFGQGLNIAKHQIRRTRSNLRANIPIIDQTRSFVATSADGMIAYVNNSRKDKIPALIMPRGIGNRYYCIFNSCKALSYSHVEAYIPRDLWKSEFHYCLWIYLNSSFVWLYREITGRKNLGQGLLKAEATDMKKLPIHFQFDFYQDAKEIFNILKNREPLSVDQEIHTKEHLRIDKLISDYFNLDAYETQQIRNTLVEQVNFRCSRAH